MPGTRLVLGPAEGRTRGPGKTIPSRPIMLSLRRQSAALVTAITARSVSIVHDAPWSKIPGETARGSADNSTKARDRRLCNFLSPPGRA